MTKFIHKHLDRKVIDGASVSFNVSDDRGRAIGYMRSFGTKTIGGQVYLYRKPGSMVNVFGTWKLCGRQFFNAWRFYPATADMDVCQGDEEQKLWDAIQ